MLVIAIPGATTVTALGAVLVIEPEVAVMLVVPAPTAVITPVALTVATALLEEVKVTTGVALVITGAPEMRDWSDVPELIVAGGKPMMVPGAAGASWETELLQ